jgi:6-pyruvoyltetrahydropterin/6-carboxytetrahydropterin synthase
MNHPINHAIAIRHNFETAHRLPHLGGRCANLHGHSWWAQVAVIGPELDDGVLVEFGAFKARVRAWIDAHLDHGAMLGSDDPLVPALLSANCKVYRFGAADAGEHEKLAYDLAWPTVENVAVMLARASAVLLDGVPHAAGCQVGTVTVTETAVNEACFDASALPVGGVR